jgi:hypothetical protein
MKKYILFLVSIPLIWISCNKNLQSPALSTKAYIRVSSVGIKTKFIDFARTLPSVKSTSLAFIHSNNLVNKSLSLNASGNTSNPEWQNILGGRAYIQFSSNDPALGIIKDSLDLTALSSYSRYLNDGTYTISLYTPSTVRAADTFLRFSAIDSGFVINGNTNIGFYGISRDGLITIPDSLIQAGNTPNFILSSGGIPYPFGHVNGYYYLYILGNTSGTLNLISSKKQIGSSTLTVQSGYQYNVSLNTNSGITNSAGPITVSFSPFINQNTVISLYSGYPFVKTLLGDITNSIINGAYTTSHFQYLQSIVSDKNGNIFFLDGPSGNILKRDANGNTTSFANTPNTGSMAMDKLGNLFVGGGNSIVKIDPSGTLTTFVPDPKQYPYGDIDGPPGTAQINDPVSLTFGPDGNLYFLEGIVGTLRKMDPNGNISTIHLNFPLPTLPGKNAYNNNRYILFFPRNLAIDVSGNFYLSQFGNYDYPTEGAIYKIRPSGDISLFAGSGNIGSMDGPGNYSSFYNPGAMIFDNQGNLLVSDFGNNKIRKIDPNGNVTTYAGTGNPGSTDGFLNAATLSPLAMTFAPNGNLYFSDNTYAAIREIFINVNQ